MRHGLLWRGALILGISSISFVSLGCGGSQADAGPPTVQGTNSYQNQPQAPGGQPGVYVPPGATVVPPQQAQQPPGVYAPQATGQNVQGTTPPPSPLSPMCTDLTASIVCAGARCNPQNGRCAVPCGSVSDCMPGYTCLGAGGPTALCVPGTGQ